MLIERSIIEVQINFEKLRKCAWEFISINPKKPLQRRYYAIIQLILFTPTLLLNALLAHKEILVTTYFNIILIFWLVEIPFNLRRLTSAKLSWWFEWAHLLCLTNALIMTTVSIRTVSGLLISGMISTKIIMLVAPSRIKQRMP